MKTISVEIKNITKLQRMVLAGKCFWKNSIHLKVLGDENKILINRKLKKILL